MTEHETLIMLDWNTAPTPTLQPVTPAPAFAPDSASNAADTTARRVNAADKRIINGQTDVRKNTWPPAPTTGCRRKST